VGEEGGRHLAVPAVGCVCTFGDGAGSHLVGEQCVAVGGAAGKPRRGARAQPMDRGTNDEVGQRHPLGGADHRGDKAHGITPFCSSNRKKRAKIVAIGRLARGGRTATARRRASATSPGQSAVATEAGASLYKMVMHYPEDFG
jgi:hypothetical protein